MSLVFNAVHAGAMLALTTLFPMLSADDPQAPPNQETLWLTVTPRLIIQEEEDEPIVHVPDAGFAKRVSVASQTARVGCPQDCQTCEAKNEACKHFAVCSPAPEHAKHTQYNVHVPCPSGVVVGQPLPQELRLTGRAFTFAPAPHPVMDPFFMPPTNHHVVFGMAQPTMVAQACAELAKAASCPQDSVAAACCDKPAQALATQVKPPCDSTACAGQSCQSCPVATTAANSQCSEAACKGGSCTKLAGVPGTCAEAPGEKSACVAASSSCTHASDETCPACPFAAVHAQLTGGHATLPAQVMANPYVLRWKARAHSPQPSVHVTATHCGSNCDKSACSQEAKTFTIQVNEASACDSPCCTKQPAKEATESVEQIKQLAELAIEKARLETQLEMAEALMERTNEMFAELLEVRTENAKLTAQVEMMEGMFEHTMEMYAEILEAKTQSVQLQAKVEMYEKLKTPAVARQVPTASVKPATPQTIYASPGHHQALQELAKVKAENAKLKSALQQQLKVSRQPEAAPRQ